MCFKVIDNLVSRVGHLVTLAFTERIMIGALNHYLHYSIEVGGRIHEENGDFTL